MAFSINNQPSHWHHPVNNAEHAHIDVGSFSDSSQGLAHMSSPPLGSQPHASDMRSRPFMPTHPAFAHEPKGSAGGQGPAVNSYTTSFHDPGKNHYLVDNATYNYQYNRGQPTVQIDVREFLHNFERQVQSVNRNVQQVIDAEGGLVERGEARVPQESNRREEGQERSGINVKTEVVYDSSGEKSKQDDTPVDISVDELPTTTTDKEAEKTTETQPTESAVSQEKPVSSQVQNSEDSPVKSTVEESPRKNKRKISRAQKRTKPAATDSQPLFAMVKKEASGNVVNITEDSLKAMIEESLKNITAGKKGNIDTTDIVDASLKSVTAAVMATATLEEPSPGPSPTKKRRKKASPRKIEIQDKDQDYDPIMDEDTEIDEDWVDTPQVKRSKVKRKRQQVRKKKKPEPKGDDHEKVEEGEGQSAEGKDGNEVKKVKKVRTPKPKKPKKEKGPRIREKKSLMCEICGKVFMRNDLLRNHKRCHSGDKPFVCTECGVSFRELGHLKRHMTIHTGKKPYKCDICGKELNSSLAKHRKRHLNDRQFPCSMCDKRFVCAFELKQHTQSHFKTDQMPCSTCGKLCSTPALMKRHQQSHSEERNHMCTVCGQKFKTKQDCERHQTVHYASPTCTCHLCGKQFTQERYLKRHIDRHNRPSSKIGYEEITPEKPFQCNYCFKTFATNTSLNQHLALHYNKGYYPCYICSKMFTQQKYLKRHIKRHLGEEVDSSEDSMMMEEEEELSRSLPPYGSMDGEEELQNAEQQVSCAVQFPDPEQSSSTMDEQLQ